MVNKTDYTLLYPPVIEFGWGSRRRLPEVIAARGFGLSPGVVLVCSRTLARSGRRAELEALCGGNICACLHDVPHDPPLAAVNALLAAMREPGCQLVVAVGGGSVIDAAKAAAVIAPIGEHVEPFFRGERAIEGPGLPFVALPTTAGTGAEITKNSVLTDVARNVKKSLRSDHMVPTAAIVDPELTVTLPPSITAASGMDALTQAVESFLSTRAHNVSRSLAAAAVRLLMAGLPGAYADGGNREARTDVAEGSLLSAMAFSQSGLGAVHGLAHPVGLALDAAHGLVCAVLLPHVLRWNAPACDPELGRLASVTGYSGAEEFIGAIEELCRALGIPRTFAAMGLADVHVEYIVANCRSGSMAANPRPMEDDDVRALLRRLTDGGQG
jgi:alcohol dehydrogenase class IV